MYNANNRIFISEDLPFPYFFNFAIDMPDVSMLYSSAAFIRNEENKNITINIPTGPDISPGSIWLSPNIYLADNTFNLSRPISEITYPNNKDVLILKDLSFLHDVFIQFKLTKSDGTNYSNNRELRCILTRGDGATPYDSSFYANQMPTSNAHDSIQLRGHIQHNLNDLVRLKFNVVQDNENADTTDTKLTIFRINWNLLGLLKT
jgi:hypothetical protein